MDGVNKMKTKVLMLVLALFIPSTSFAAMQTFVSGDGLAEIRTKLLANDSELYGKVVTGASLSGTILTFTFEDATTFNVDIAGVQDGTGTDDQAITDLSLSGNIISLTLENGGTETVDLTSILGAGGLADAPSDGSTYGRNDGAWVAVSGSVAVDSTIQNGSTNPVQNDAIYDALAGKQNALVNPVVLADTSGWDKDSTDDFDGAYNSLTGRPTLFDGAYGSLTGTPTIPTNNNQLTNGANYLTQTAANAFYSLLGHDHSGVYEPAGITLSDISDIGTAAGRAVEDTMTNGSNLPDGSAIIAYGNANWLGGSSFDLSADHTFTGMNTFTGGISTGPISFEGATADDYETSFVITDPTADRALNLGDYDMRVPASAYVNTSGQILPAGIVGGVLSPTGDGSGLTGISGTFSVTERTTAPTAGEMASNTFAIDTVGEIAYVQTSTGLASWPLTAFTLNASTYTLSLTLAGLDGDSVNGVSVAGPTDITGLNSASYALTEVFGGTNDTVVCTGSAVSGSANNYTVDMSDSNESATCTFSVASGGGTISYIGAESSTSFSTDLTLNVPTGTQDGDILVTTVADDTDQALTHTGWTLITSQSVTSSRNTVAYRLASSEPASYTFTSGSSEKAGSIAVFRKTGGTWDVGAFSSASTTIGNTTLTSSEITTTDNSILYTAWSNDGNVAVTTPPSGMVTVVEVSGSSVKSDAYYELVATGAATTKTINYAANEDISCIAVSIDIIP